MVFFVNGHLDPVPVVFNLGDEEDFFRRFRHFFALDDDVAMPRFVLLDDLVGYHLGLWRAVQHALVAEEGFGALGARLADVDLAVGVGR